MTDEPVVVATPPSLSACIAARDAAACAAWVEQSRGLETVRTLSLLSNEEREVLLGLLTPAAAAEVIEALPDAQAVGAVESLAPETAARILEELPSNEQADLIGELDEEEAQAILEHFEDEDAEEVRRLAAYEDDEAGGLMITEYLSYPATATVAEVLGDLELKAEEYAHYNIQYAYITTDRHRLVGVLPLRRLLLAPRRSTLDKLMVEVTLRVTDKTSLDELATLFRESPFLGLPVVNERGRLVGVVERASLEQALVEEADETYRASQGIVGGEELRSMPLWLRSRRRLAWLSANVGLNVIAASVIATHQDTLAAAITLAVFLPIISDMSGCSGNQAVAVSMRELTLGVLVPRDALRVLAKELSVGLINGIALGLLVGGAALLWKGNVYLGLVVGGALMLNTLIAVAVGGTIPLVLKGLKLDPALASGPILTTVTDMCGFFLVLTFASAVLTRLM